MAVDIEADHDAAMTAPALPDVPIWRLTVEQYHQMIGAGVLTDGDSVELLEGWLVAKMTIKPPHALATELTRDKLASIIGDEWFVNSQQPISTQDSEPEPDVTVIRGARREFADRHPGPADVGLVVEVADVTLNRDRRIKKSIYARAGIPCYWIVNLLDRKIEVCYDPTGPAANPDYRCNKEFHTQDDVPVVLDGREIARITVSELLP